MEAALAVLLPTLLGDGITFRIYPHQGKPDLFKKLPGKLAAYAKWLPSTYRLIIVVDRDRDDEAELKQQIDRSASRVALITEAAPQTRWQLASRLAIEELEAWYFGDWAAVRCAYPRVKANVDKHAAYRDPDAIEGGTWEAFERELQCAGYFATGLRKIEAARAVAEHMVPARNRSASFRALKRLLGELAATG